MRKVVDPKSGKVREVQEPVKSADRDAPRDINEDDDGYHPYSDRVEHAPMFEEDPWR